MKHNEELNNLLVIQIKKYSDSALTMYIDQVRQLRAGADLFDTVFWMDFDEYYKILLNECVERIRVRIPEEEQ